MGYLNQKMIFWEWRIILTREERKRFNYEQTYKIINDILYKKCSVCPEDKAWKPMTEKYFYKWNNSSDGFHAQCIEDSKIKARKRKADKKEECNKKDREYRKKNHIVRQKKEKEWRQDNREHVRNYYRDYRIKNIKQISGYQQKRQEKNHIIADIEWHNCKMYFNMRCAYCGRPIEEHYVIYRGKTKLGDFHKEHVIHTGKNDLSNCIPSCLICNSTKHEKSLNQFYNESNPYYTYERYYRIYLWLRYDYKKYIMPKRKKNQKLTTRLKEIETNKTKYKK